MMILTEDYFNDLEITDDDNILDDVKDDVRELYDDISRRYDRTMEISFNGMAGYEIPESVLELTAKRISNLFD